MKRRLIYLILCLLAGPGRNALAGISTVESDAGLPDKYITAICRDGRGLMWIGTRQGLCMYDGYRFLPLGGTLQFGTLISKLLYQAPGNTLWALTDKGLYSIHCSTRKITLVTAAGLGMATDICITPDGHVYAAYKSGAIAAMDTGNRCRVIARFPATGSNIPYPVSLQADDNDMLSMQLAGRHGPYRLKIATGLLEQLPDSTDRNAFFRKAYGNLLVLGRTGGGLEIRDRRTHINLFLQAAGAIQTLENVVDVHLTSSGTLYALCRWPSALIRVDLQRRLKDTVSSEVFTGRLLTCFYVDPQNIIWIGTNKGLIRFTEEQRLFDHFLVQKPPVSVRTLAEDESGYLYAGTYSGLFRSKDQGNHWSFLGDMLPYALHNMPGRYVYFVGEQNALYRIDKLTARAETGFYKTEGLPADELRQAYSLESDEQGRLWIGTSYGLAVYDPADRILSAWKAEGLPANTRIYGIRNAPGGRLWLCTDKGLFELDKEKGVVGQLSTRTSPALSGNKILYVDEDAEGRLWICTGGRGINIVSRDRHQVTFLKTEDGLSDNETYHLLWQGRQRVWISTFNGLSCYSPRSRTFYNYYTADGLTSNEFNHNAFLRDHTGKMHFGTINGINAFYPDSINHTDKPARLLASAISKWDNKAGAVVSLPSADTITTIILRPLDHSLTINLALTDYTNPGNNIFRYRLQGLFNEWVSLDGQQALRLNGLAAGNYILEIIALDSRGTPAANMLRYRIEVRQAFYKSWWFYLGMFLLASGLLWAFFTLRLQHVKKVQLLRERIASDLHDEVGSLLTRITMTSDNLRYSMHADADKSLKLEKIAALSRTAASSMSDILWSIDARNDYTGNLADRMREHAEEMLLPLDVDLRFDFNVSQRMSISSQLRQQLYLIFKEAVNNIVKHSHASAVRIGYHHNEQGFRLSIDNDGYTVPEKVSTGQGLRNMDMRAGRVKARVETGGKGDHFIVLVTGR